jgi:hypothetical protein
MKFIAPIFLGSGIGLLISPAFVPSLALWNMFGFLPLIIGFYFTGKALDKQDIPA